MPATLSFPALARTRSRWAAFWCVFAVFLLPAAAADLYWNFGTVVAGDPPNAPSQATSGPSAGLPVANLAVGDVAQGNNKGTTIMLTTSSVSSGYAVASGSVNAGLAARIGPLNTEPGGSAYFEVVLTPAPGFSVNVSGITFGSRSTETGPLAYSLRSNLDSFAADAASGILKNDSKWGLRNTGPLTLSSGGPLTLRIYGFNGTGSPGPGTVNFRMDDLTVSADITPGGAPAPTLTSFSPATGQAGTAVTINGTNFGAAPTVSFSGTSAPGATVNAAGTMITATVPPGAATGPITVSAPGGSATSNNSFTFLATPSMILSVSPNSVMESDGPNAAIGTLEVETASAAPVTITLSSSDVTEATVPTTVILPSGAFSVTFPVAAVADGVADPAAAVTLTATATGYTPASVVLTVTNVDSGSEQPTSVVINKYLNAAVVADDTVELLVAGNGTAGSILDMRGMILKDFSSSMGSDGGGKYTFSSDPLLAAVKAGTLIVLTNNATTTDNDPTDFVLRLGMKDLTYFTFTAGWDISATDMVMIKSAGSDSAGVTGSIHVLGNGSEGSNFTSAAPRKLLASGTIVTGTGVTADNPNGTLADYDGSNATGGVTFPVGAFGTPNSAGNAQFIRALRGIAGNSGDGAATLTNATPDSPLAGRNIFRRNLTGQVMEIILTGQLTAGTITRVELTVPAAFGAVLPGDVAVTGAGAGAAPAVTVTGQTVSLTGTAITNMDAAAIRIMGLAMPALTNLNDDGIFPMMIKTAGIAGDPAAIALSPKALVTVPVANLRDVDETGLPVDNNKVVAIEATCTVENFNTGAPTSAFVQDGAFGINIFQPGLTLGLVRDNKYIITGVVTPFNGLTELKTNGAQDVMDLGAVTPVIPATLTVAALRAHAEQYEGRLVKVKNMALKDGEEDFFSNLNTITLQDGPIGGDFLDVFIQAGSTATVDPAYPADITGIFMQYDNSSPYTSGYELCPRDEADLRSEPVGEGYSAWAASYPGIGEPETDADGDGQSNYLEYALGTVPNDRSSVQELAVTRVGGLPTFAITKGSAASADAGVTYLIEGSTDLANWSGTTDLTVPANTASSYSRQYTGTSPEYFFRLRVN